MTAKQYIGALVVLGLGMLVVVCFPFIALVTLPLHCLLVGLGRRGMWRKRGTEFIFDHTSFERAA